LNERRATLEPWVQSTITRIYVRKLHVIFLDQVASTSSVLQLVE
jgi:hypothetical protein